MKQTTRIISTYSADTFGVCSALFELGGMVIMHDASGCNSTYTTHDEPRWYDMDSMVYISALTEMEAIMGDDEKLLGDIEEAVSDLHPKFVAIAGTPIPTMTGFDFESVAAVAEQRTGVPCFGFATTGMNTYIHGASMAFEALAKSFVYEPDKKNEDASERSSHDGENDNNLNKRIKVNIIGLTPLDFSINDQDSSIAEWLESEGFEVVSRWAMGSSADEIARAGSADVNLVVSASGRAAAKVLFERFGIPYLVGVPIGREQKECILANLEELTEEKKESEGLGHDVRRSEFMVVQADITYDYPERKKEDLVAIIGEGVTSLALANAIELELDIPTKVICATECPEGILRSKDRILPDEEDIMSALGGAAIVIADPLYKPICPAETKFISLPHEAFSGRLYRSDIPNLVENSGDFLKKLQI